MSSALEIFDVFQTIGISLCLAITIPFACFIYYKLIFTGPFSENYTFKLIVLNGITELLNCIAYLIAYQLISYPFMAGMYTFLQNTGIVAPLTISSCFLAGFSLHTSLFIALNRLKTIMFIRLRNNDSTFFFISVISSTVLTGPAVTDLCLFTTIIYASFTYNDETIMYPKNKLTNNSLRVVSDIIRIFVSLATLVINIILSVMITRERKFINFAERQKQVFARYFDMLIFGYAQWLFLGFNAMTPFWCLLLFTPSIRRLVPQITIQPRATTIPIMLVNSRRAQTRGANYQTTNFAWQEHTSFYSSVYFLLLMFSALEIFDIVQTVGITVCLIVTIPSAFFVYAKLIFVRPFSRNYTFKLIVINGVTELLSCVLYLINVQLITYPFMVGFYTSVQDARLVTPLTIAWVFLACLSLHSSLFVALNRLKTIIFIRKKSNDSIFFIISILVSITLALPTVLDYSITTTVIYSPFMFNGALVMLPNNISTDDSLFLQTLRTISDIIRFIVSLATLVANIILSVLITRERNFFHFSDRQRFNGEKGLVITSIASYTFYMLYFINNVIARYIDVMVCGFVQWLFLGLNAIAPFWCLIMFTPSVRRMALNKRRNSAATTILRQTVTILNNPELDFSIPRISSALEIFDIFQTIVISACLIVTIPSAVFVYLKLICIRPFSQNYTFKLIVINGITVSKEEIEELLNCVFYLINYQLISYPFMVGFYTSIQAARLVTPLSEPAIAQLLVMIPNSTTSDEVISPLPPPWYAILRTISDVIRFAVSLATLVVNIILSVLITRRAADEP
ncbi:hypothetical protein PRIPAC_97634, partial [Pristionchus pacificus]|uniref:Uncharacterized protein n=1 Tax=Pristionchus pacificus TaxID=54126 RepID=A0A2A6BIU9_PRIPA